MLANVGAPIIYPTMAPLSSNGLFLSTYTISNSGDKLAYVFQAIQSGYLNGVAFAAQPTVPTHGSTMRFSFQSVDSSGNPTKIQDQYIDLSPTAYTQFNASPMTSTGHTGGSQRAVQQGDWVALVVEFGNYVSPDTFSLAEINANGGLWGGGEEHFAHYILSSNTWTKLGNNPSFSLQYTDNNFYPFNKYGCLQYGSNNLLTLTSVSSPNEAGIYFSLPFEATILGAAVSVGIATSGNFTWNLYDVNNNILTTYTYIQNRDGSTNVNPLYKSSIFPNRVLLQAGAFYRITITATTTNNVNLNYLNYLTVGDLQAEYPFLQNGTWAYTNRTNGGAWSSVIPSVTASPLISLLLSSISNTAMVNRLGLGGGLQ